ncbi:MAG: hypothetical protein QOE14_1115 [Humisphaera sp.]|nr:hypothetical protein [Humisphaera sp.]
MATTNKKNQQQSKQKKEAPLRKRVEATLQRLERKDPGLKNLLKKAYGYAVFPAVGKAALVVGGAYGRGAVFERGKMIGYATMAQMTIGVQIGGDTFTEILIFHDREALKRFKSGRMAFAANASAVLVKAAAAGTSNFSGVTAHAYSDGGMLLELSLGGQKFKFRALGEEQDEEKGAKNKSEDQDESEEEEGEEGGMMSRALQGMRGATSKVTDLAKEHPIAATVVGAGLATGLAFLAMRALRESGVGGGSSAREDDDSDEESDENDEATEARGSDDREDDDESEDQSEEEDDDDSENNHAGMKRHQRRFRA